MCKYFTSALVIENIFSPANILHTGICLCWKNICVKMVGNLNGKVFAKIHYHCNDWNSLCSYFLWFLQFQTFAKMQKKTKKPPLANEFQYSVFRHLSTNQTLLVSIYDYLTRCIFWQCEGFCAVYCYNLTATRLFFSCSDSAFNQLDNTSLDKDSGQPVPAGTTCVATNPWRAKKSNHLSFDKVGIGLTNGAVWSWSVFQ